MASVGTVVVELDANTAKLVEGVKKSQRQLSTLQKSVNGAKNSLKDIAKYAVGFYAVAKGMGAVSNAAKSFISTSAQFEQYETTLKSITGSSQKAKESMDWITDFTASTPFQLEQVTEAFVKMKAYGLDPMDGTLTTLGDTASAMGKDITQAVEAIADAVTGENERLKEFGIKASKSGDTIAYAWSDSSGKARNIVIKNNKEIIQSTLNAIFNEKYVGAMAEQSKTWNGIISNISDKWTMFQRDVMESGGLFDYLKAAALTFSEVMSEVFGKGKDGAKGFASVVIEGIKSIIRGAGVLADTFSGVGVVWGFLKTSFWQLVGVFGTGMNAIQKGWNKLGNTMSSLWATVANGVKDIFASMINWIIDKINSISSTVNKAASKVGLGAVFGTLDNVSFAKTKAEITELGEPIANVATAWQYAKEAQADYQKSISEIASGAGQEKAEEIIANIDRHLENILSKEKASNEVKEKTRSLLDDHIKQYGQQAEAVDKVAKKAKEVNKEAETIKNVYSDAANSMENAMGSAFSSWQDGALNFKETMSNVIKDIAAMIFQQLVVKQMFSGLSGLFGGGSILGAFASGGDVLTTGSYLVGEQGPEVVTLPEGAHVTPNDKLGGTTVNVNVQNYGNDNVEVKQNGNDIQVIISQIASGISRGTGDIGKALEGRYGLRKV